MGKILSGENEFTIGDSWADGEYLKLDTGAIVSAAVSGGGGIVYDTQANRPAAGTQGREFIPTDGYGPTRQIDSGAAWIHLYNGFQCTNPPAYDTFTVVNSLAGTTLTQDGDQISALMYGAAGTSSYNTTWLTALPAAPYTFTVGLHIKLQRLINYVQAGVVLSNGTDTSSEFSPLYIEGTTAGTALLSAQKYSAINTFVANYANQNYASTAAVMFLQIEDDNTNRYYRFSPNGKTWSLLYSVGRTNYLTPTHCGLWIGHNTTNIAATCIAAHYNVIHWSLG